MQVACNPHSRVLGRLRSREVFLRDIFDGEDRNLLAGGAKLVLDVVYVAKVHATIRWSGYWGKAGKYLLRYWRCGSKYGKESKGQI